MSSQSLAFLNLDRKIILSSDIPPTSDQGELGDYCISKSNMRIYGPKTNLGWGNGFPLAELIGPPGPIGPIGPLYLFFSVLDVPLGGEVFNRILIPEAMSLAANLVGCKGVSHDLATDTAVILLVRGEETLGTLTFTSAGTEAALATTGGTAKALAAGDVVEIKNHAVADATWTGSITLKMILP